LTRQAVRFFAFVCMLALLGQSTALPARAMSTATEIAQGRAESAQVDAHSIKVTDPFLVSWVNAVGNQLAQHRRRRDITYTFTILDEPDINAFAMKGGFIHVDMGLLNFVSSDDELAATLGHEMGHVELRHVVKSSNQGTIVGILTAIVSIVSPVAGMLGDIGGELAQQKFSRLDELQADHYGMRLADQSGFDPQAAVDVMAKLGQMDPGPGSKADKAFIDHPVPQDRIAHLLGYPELDRPSAATLIEEAIHDQQEGRYSYAIAKLKQVKDGTDQALVEQHMTELNYALRESGSLAAPDSRVMLTAVLPDDPRRLQAAAALKTAQSSAQNMVDKLKSEDRLGSGDLQNLEQQLNNLSNDMAQDQSQAPQPSTAGSAGGGSAPDPMAKLDADITGTIDLIDDVFSTAPGLLGPNQDTLREMAEPLEDAAPLTPKYQALLPYYPQITAAINESNGRLMDSVEDSRAAIQQALQATQMMQAAYRAAASATPPPSRGRGAPGQSRFPMMSPILSAWDAALDKAEHASDEMYAAQAADLSAEITLLDLESAPERYAAFAKALERRFPGEQPPSYAQATHLGIAPGEMACASWYAFDTHEQFTDVLENFKRANESCEDAALDRHLMGESMEIAEGLIYSDYIDAPEAVK
jgi:Zn-dependent protease with chaperone function